MLSLHHKNKDIMTLKEIRDDLDKILEMSHRYNNFIWAPQEGQPDHFDNQPKNTRLAMSDIRVGLYTVKSAMMNILEHEGLIEPETDKNDGKQ